MYFLPFTNLFCVINRSGVNSKYNLRCSEDSILASYVLFAIDPFTTLRSFN